MLTEDEKIELLRLEEMDLARKSILDFTLYTFPQYEVNWHHKLICDTLDVFVHTNKIPRLMIFAPPRMGKALAVFTPILTTNGWKTIGDIEIGDSVFDANGNPTKVIAVSDVFKNRPCYIVETDDGYPIIADENHLWNVRLCRKGKYFGNYTTKYLANRRSQRNPMIKVSQSPIPGMKVDLPIPPYTLGVWLGDGCQNFGYITKTAQDLDEIEIHIKNEGFETRRHADTRCLGILGLQKKLRIHNFLRNKRIPDEYLIAPIEARLALLQGLIDTDGFVAPNGQIEFTSTNKRIAEGVQRLVWSFGVKAFLSTGTAMLNGVSYGDKYRVNFYMENAARLWRKIKNCRNAEIRKNRYITFQESLHFDTRCIQVENPDGLFLAGHAFVVTHNSELVSRRLPAFILGQDPNARIISCSYSADLANMMSRDVQRVIDSDEYKRLFPETRLPGGEKGDSAWVRTTEYWEIPKKNGRYRASGAMGGITGIGADWLIVDDILKNQEEADSPTIRQKLWDWYTTTAYTRLEKGGKVCLMMTRWHEDDLAGRLLEQSKKDPDADKWYVLSLPALAEAPMHRRDPRAHGEPLWPGKYSLKTMRAIRGTVGERAWNSLFQQRPSSQEGGILKKMHWKYYDRLPEKFDQVIQSWDMAFKDKADSDYAACIVLGRVGDDLYVIDRLKERLGIVATLEAVKKMAQKWPMARRKLVEDKANGTAVVDLLKDKVPGLILVEPRGGKVSRANAAAPSLEEGRVYLPVPERVPWVNEFIETCAAFPNVKNDDDVDAFTQAVLDMKGDPRKRLMDLLKE